MKPSTLLGVLLLSVFAFTTSIRITKSYVPGYAGSGMAYLCNDGAYYTKEEFMKKYSPEYQWTWNGQTYTSEELYYAYCPAAGKAREEQLRKEEEQKKELEALRKLEEENAKFYCADGRTYTKAQFKDRYMDDRLFDYNGRTYYGSELLYAMCRPL